MSDQTINSINMNDHVEKVEKIKPIKTIKKIKKIKPTKTIKTIKPIFELEEDIIDPKDYKLINIDNIVNIPTEYPSEFTQFCELNDLKPPHITSKNGKALAAMLVHPHHYWNRTTCNAFVQKFGIITKDSIQIFNKHSQWGIQTNSGKKRGNLYIIYPYELSNKHKMRKNFEYDGTESQKNIEINKIKSTIKTDYIDVPNEQWQLGHKNPGSTNNTSTNLILQPPIQGKYRDNYIFIDTLTKIPVPSKLKSMVDLKEIELTDEQIDEYIIVLRALKTKK